MTNLEMVKANWRKHIKETIMAIDNYQDLMRTCRAYAELNGTSEEEVKLIKECYDKRREELDKADEDSYNYIGQVKKNAGDNWRKEYTYYPYKSKANTKAEAIKEMRANGYYVNPKNVKRIEK